jgi:hypothetical protein
MSTGIVVSVTPTLDTNAYASGDHMGTLHTIPGYAHGPGLIAVLNSLTIVDLAQQKSALDVFFFDASPTISSSDNAAANIADAQSTAKCIGHVVVAAADYRDIGSANSIACVKNIGLTVKANPEATAPNSIYAFVVSRGSPTYAASDLTFKYAFQWVM